MLVGRENVGKTSILTSLNALLNDPKHSRKGRSDKSKKPPPHIPLLRYGTARRWLSAQQFAQVCWRYPAPMAFRWDDYQRKTGHERARARPRMPSLSRSSFKPTILAARSFTIASGGGVGELVNNLSLWSWLTRAVLSCTRWCSIRHTSSS